MPDPIVEKILAVTLIFVEPAMPWVDNRLSLRIQISTKILNILQRFFIDRWETPSYINAWSDFVGCQVVNEIIS